MGAELFLFGLIAYYLRMVRHDRICLAVGGMNLGISAYSALLAYLVISGSLPISLPQNMISLLFGAAIIVSVTYLTAGILSITQKAGE